MTAANISDLAQALAAVATVIGLFFVGYQIRQNTRATRAAAHHSVSDSLNEMNRMFAESADLTKIWLTGMQDRKALSPEDAGGSIRLCAPTCTSAKRCSSSPNWVVAMTASVSPKRRASGR